MHIQQEFQIQSSLYLIKVRFQINSHEHPVISKKCSSIKFKVQIDLCILLPRSESIPQGQTRLRCRFNYSDKVANKIKIQLIGD